MDIQIRCEPSETAFVSTLIKDRSAEALQRRAEPLICITAQEPPHYFQRTVGGGKVLFIHYKMLHIFANPKNDQAAVLEAMRIAQQEVLGSGEPAAQSAP